MLLIPVKFENSGLDRSLDGQKRIALLEKMTQTPMFAS